MRVASPVVSSYANPHVSLTWVYLYTYASLQPVSSSSGVQRPTTRASLKRRPEREAIALQIEDSEFAQAPRLTERFALNVCTLPNEL